MTTIRTTSVRPAMIKQPGSASSQLVRMPDRKMQSAANTGTVVITTTTLNHRLEHNATFALPPRENAPENALKSVLRAGKRLREHNRSTLMAQFRFQPFKKCFRGRCLTIFVPGDFKPSSPRRMFCSVECFEAHWRERLFKYLQECTDKRNIDVHPVRTY